MEKPFFGKLFEFLQKHQYTIVLVLFVLVITVASDNSLVRRASVRREIRSLKGQIERLEQEMEQNRKVLLEMSNDSLIIEHLARERFYMHKSDEVVFIEQQ